MKRKEDGEVESESLLPSFFGRSGRGLTGMVGA